MSDGFRLYSQNGFRVCCRPVSSGDRLLDFITVQSRTGLLD